MTVISDELRADRLLSQLNLGFTRTQAQKLIANGKVFYLNKDLSWSQLEKPSQLFSSEYIDPAKWRVDADASMRFVSRGGLKLDGALKHFALSCQGKVCWDVGLSTGGFSHCLLENGAKKILGVDVGQGQLHPTLMQEPRLMSAEKINARNPLPQALVDDFFTETEKHTFDLIVVDVSFISLEKLVGNLVSYLENGGYLLALVKPQFELGSEQLNKKGVLKQSVDPLLAVSKNIDIFKQHNLQVLGDCESSIVGENGNREYFILAQKVS